MRRIGVIFIFAVMCATLLAQDSITVNVNGAKLADVFTIIARYAGKNIIVKGNTDHRVTMSVQDVDYRQVLRMLAFSYDLKISETSGIIIVRGDSRSSFEKDKVIRIFHLQYARADDVANILKATFKNLKEFSVSVDNRKNVVIVCCLRSDIGLIEKSFP